MDSRTAKKSLLAKVSNCIGLCSALCCCLLLFPACSPTATGFHQQSPVIVGKASRPSRSLSLTGPTANALAFSPSKDTSRHGCTALAARESSLLLSPLPKKPAKSMKFSTRPTFCSVAWGRLDRCWAAGLRTNALWNFFPGGGHNFSWTLILLPGLPLINLLSWPGFSPVLTVSLDKLCELQEEENPCNSGNVYCFDDSQELWLVHRAADTLALSCNDHMCLKIHEMSACVVIALLHRPQLLPVYQM